MLKLINKARADCKHLPPVSLGDNQAAQLHAQDMLDTCFLSHWGSDGLKPHMRYTLTNGQQANSENASLNRRLLQYCPDRHRSHPHPARHQHHARPSWPAHRTPQGYPQPTPIQGQHRHRHVASHHAFVQQFEKNYNQFTALPAIQGSRLTFAGTANISTASGENIRLTATITYDPPPHALTTRQLASTHRTRLRPLHRLHLHAAPRQHPPPGPAPRNDH